MKIGRSLSACVADIAEGKVDINDVEYIEAGTKAKSDEDWEYVFKFYARTMWRKDPDKCREIAQSLIKEHKVIQTRLMRLPAKPFPTWRPATRTVFISKREMSSSPITRTKRIIKLGKETP